MFLSDPILWLQSWASPPLTAAMEFISWFGYTRAAVAVIALLAFAFRLRPAVAILVLVALTAVATDVAKPAFASGRPYLEDVRVVALGSFVPSDAADSDSGFGLPSGHVSTTTAVILGMVTFFRWRGAWWALLCVVPLMALSRLYLGRHYLGDVLGGALLGCLMTIGAVLVLRLTVYAQASEWRRVRRVAALNVLAALAVVALGWVTGWPGLTDAGRLAGVTAAALVIARLEVEALPPSKARRALLVMLAGAAFAIAWAVATFALSPVDAESPVRRLIIAAVPVIAMLLVPCWLMRRSARRLTI